MSRKNPVFSTENDPLAVRHDTPAHTWPRLFVTQDLGTQTPLNLGGDQSHYLVHVMRVHQGSPIRLFNGRDGDWKAIVTQCNKRDLSLLVTEQLRPQTIEPDLWLCCAPIKKAYFEYMIMKATELGVSRIIPILTARTQIRDVNLSRCHDIAVEAAEQSERLSVPEIVKPLTFNDFASNRSPDRPLYYCAEFGDAQPLDAALIQQKDKQIKALASFLTGPEGGFTKEEMEKLHTLPTALPVRLGPRILRADTAALAALACWQSVCGDWNE